MIWMEVNDLWKENAIKFLSHLSWYNTKEKLISTECKIVFEQQYSHVAVTDTDLEQQTQLSWKQTNCWALGFDVTRKP